MKTIQKIFEYILELIDTSIVILVGVALVLFLWGILKYFWYSNSEEKRRQGNAFMVYGVLSLLVITSLWGFIYLFADLFGIKLVGAPQKGKTQESLVDDPLGKNISKSFGEKTD